MENRCKNETRFYISSKITLLKKQVFGKGCMYVNHMNPAVELRVGEGSPENEKIKN